MVHAYTHSNSYNIKYYCVDRSEKFLEHACPGLDLECKPTYPVSRCPPFHDDIILLAYLIFISNVNIYDCVCHTGSKCMLMQYNYTHAHSIISKEYMYNVLCTFIPPVLYNGLVQVIHIMYTSDNLHFITHSGTNVNLFILIMQTIIL